jgi:hypothetical protein
VKASSKDQRPEQLRKAAGLARAFNNVPRVSITAPKYKLSKLAFAPRLKGLTDEQRKQALADQIDAAAKREQQKRALEVELDIRRSDIYVERQRTARKKAIADQNSADGRAMNAKRAKLARKARREASYARNN